MQKRQLGSAGFAVSVLGLGTVKLGRDQQVKYPHGFTIPDDAAVTALLEQAKELGINLIDTAPAYGNSEERLGQLLPNRNDWVIVTKVGEAFENGQSLFDFSSKTTRDSVHRSLKRLRRDFVDVVLVHSDGNDMDIIHNAGALEALNKLKDQGHVRAFGMSTKTLEGGLWVVQHCDVVMATCNLSEHQDLPVLEEAQRLNKGVVVKKGLQSGHADASVGGAGVEESFEFVLNQAGVNSMIVGTINPDHLRHNVEICNQVAPA
ncbi:MAG: aldo/keto reductase [Gammaproteobacteria bacterium]|nr:aldo/keto reductase [Gammaproteobacteria bacterium]MDH5801752.1 aldo/keto reductase [Gammaproteobacteria bacterium]